MGMFARYVRIFYTDFSPMMVTGGSNLWYYRSVTLCLFLNNRLKRKTCGGEGTAPRILSTSSIWRGRIYRAPRPLYQCAKSSRKPLDNEDGRTADPVGRSGISLLGVQTVVSGSLVRSLFTKITELSASPLQMRSLPDHYGRAHTSGWNPKSCFTAEMKRFVLTLSVPS
jgi:hypothetical protein